MVLGQRDRRVWRLSLNAVAVQGQPVGHDISKQSRASSRQAGNICTCDESLGAKWPVLQHGVQHVVSVVPRRNGSQFSGAGPGLSVDVAFVSVVLFTQEFYDPVHLNALRL